MGTLKLWPGTWPLLAAAMLRADLREAGVEAERFGQVADFHGLRATYATHLPRGGVNLQAAQALLRHSDPKLRTRTFTKLGVTDLGQAVAGFRLPQLKREAKNGGSDL